MRVPLRKILRTFYPGRFSAETQQTRNTRAGWKRYIWLLILVIVLIKATLFLVYYNTFLSLHYDVQEAQAQVDTQLQRRMNIILNLSIMVVDYAEHEREIFTHAVDTRKEMLEGGALSEGAPGPNQGDKGLAGQEAADLDALLARVRNQGGEDQSPAAASDLETLLSKVFAIAERYPELRLSENFLSFMDALVDAENKIADQRMIYNKLANEMSTAVGKFPGFIFAKIYGFEPPAFFEPDPGALTLPKVEY